MHSDQVRDRLVALRQELETGQARLRELEAEHARVRETMLRISGSIQVLEEFAGESNPDPAAAGAKTPSG